MREKKVFSFKLFNSNNKKFILFLRLEFDFKTVKHTVRIYTQAI